MERFQTHSHKSLVYGMTVIGAIGGKDIVVHFAIAPIHTFELILASMAVTAAALVLLYAMNISLGLTGTELVVLYGPFRRRFAIATITRVRESTIPYKQRALEIMVRNHGRVVLFPRDQDAFVAALRARNPAITGESVPMA
jgi:hypothetical protein